MRHLALGLVVIAALTSTATAEYIDVFTSDYAGRGTQLLDDFSLGLDFVVAAETVRISELGIWDNYGDGLQSAHRATLFDTDTGLEIASVDFAPGDGELRNGYRYLALDQAVTLYEGDAFTIAVGYGIGNLDHNGNTHGILELDPAPTLWDGGGALLNVGLSRYGNGPGYPGTQDLWHGGGPANRYLSGSFEYTPNPEPGTLVLLSSALAAGAAIRRRHKRKQLAA